MIDMYPGHVFYPHLTLLQARNKLQAQHSTCCYFDQPLFGRLNSEIVNEVEDSSPVKDVVLLLGSFHIYANEFVGCHLAIDGGKWTEGNLGDSLW